MSTPTLLTISGALRDGSTNTKLLLEAVRLFGESHHVAADIRFPLYDGDAEAAEGVPAAVQTVADQIAAADAVLISTPEYNSGPSGVLKNALDWISRTEGNPWAGKPVAVMSAAAGRAGGALAQAQLRSLMVPFRTRLLQGPQVRLAGSGSQFDENGHLTGEMYIKDLTALMDGLREEIARQAG